MNLVNCVNVKGKYAYYFLINVIEKMKIISRGYAVIGLLLLWDISVKKYEKNNSFQAAASEINIRCEELSLRNTPFTENFFTKK